MPFFVEVIIPLSLSKTFTYSLSQEEYQLVRSGMRVAVPFGKNKIYTAMVLQRHQNEPLHYQAKEIYQIIDETPIANKFQLELWQWISSYYMSTIGDVYRCAMPAALLLESETIITRNLNFEDSSGLSDEEFLLFEALQYQTSLRILDISAILGKKNVLPIIKKLIEKGVLCIHEELIEKYKPKQIRTVSLNKKYESDRSLQDLLNSISGVKKHEILLQYFQLQAEGVKPVPVKQLLERAAASHTSLKSLVSQGIFDEYYLNKDRLEYNVTQDNHLVLNAAQLQAVDEIKNNFENKDVCLLHGITASGKTEVYIELIKEFLVSGKQVLYLLPEIGLTGQILERVRTHLGSKVSVYHSKQSNNERVEVWMKVNGNASEAQVVIGARSALFLPFSNLGLVVIDEEHEGTFKQHDPAPRYQARDTAIILAQKHGAKVLLGSATPSIETYHNATSDKYSLVKLNQRHNDVELPEILYVDLKDSYFRKRMSGHFSDQLIGAISEALSAKEQVILFQNKRGYSPVVECMTCGHIPQCIHCDVSLTYHKFKNQLRCHYCGYGIANPTHCPCCSSLNLMTKGFGTEQIQLEVEALFPEARIARLDQDTTRGKYSFDRIVEQFENREIDILVGTQMLAKGLDFAHVSLVGVMNVDSLLYHPDFRAFERTYQLITQVAGRCGRHSKGGKVIIQTYNPNHPILTHISTNNYEGMYHEQLDERRLFMYPPFYRLIRITLKHREFEKLRQGADWMAAVLRQSMEIPVLGPEEPAIGRIKNQYLKAILIKIPAEYALTGTKKTIQRTLDSFESISQFRGISISLNVDMY